MQGFFSSSKDHRRVLFLCQGFFSIDPSTIYFVFSLQWIVTVPPPNVLKQNIEVPIHVVLEKVSLWSSFYWTKKNKMHKIYTILHTGHLWSCFTSYLFVRLQIILAKKTHPASRMFENIITQSREKYNK